MQESQTINHHTMKTIKELKEERAALAARMSQMLDVAEEREAKGFTAEERAKYDGLKKEYETLDERIALREEDEARAAASARRIGGDAGKTAEERAARHQEELRSTFIDYVRGAVTKPDIKEEMRAELFTGTADNQELKDLMNRLLRDANMSRALQDKVEAVVADPAEAGIDLREPLFVFGSQSFEGHVGLIGAIHSRDKLTELLDALAKDAGADRCIERDGYTYFELDGDPIVFNDDWFMLTNKSYDQDESDVIAEVSKRFEADEENSIRSNEAFKELCKSEGDVQLLLLGKGLAEIDGMRRELQDIEKQLPSGVRIDDYALVADLNLGNGEATLSARAIALTDEARNFMDENAKGLSAVEGDMLKYVPASTLLAAATHLDGKAVLDKAKEQGLLRNANPEAAKMVTDVFEALDGDIVFSFDSFNEMGQPTISAYAEVKNATFLRNLMRDYLDSGYATENATDQYQVTLDSYTSEERNVLLLHRQQRPGPAQRIACRGCRRL